MMLNFPSFYLTFFKYGKKYAKSSDVFLCPNIDKIINIAPIHKKNDRKMVSNYRPISLTCITCKVMEKIIYQQIIDHIQINNYISDSQHGFLNLYFTKHRNTWNILIKF